MAAPPSERQTDASKIDFSWSGEPGDLVLPDGVTFDALKDVARIVNLWERYINDPNIKPWVHGDGDSAIMLVLRVYEKLAPERVQPR